MFKGKVTKGFLIMEHAQKKRVFTFVYAGLALFTAISTIVPIIWEKKARREEKSVQKRLY
jgi:hypothetical protein